LREAQQQVEALARQSRDMEAHAQSAAERSGPDALPSQARMILDQLAKELARMQIRSVQPMEVTSLASAVAQSRANNWLEQAIAAGQADLHALTSRQNNTGVNPGSGAAASGTRSHDNANDPAKSTPGDSELRTGVYDQAEEKGGTQGKAESDSAARSRQSPPEYRAMVEQYYDRINQDQDKK
jgi:hypothetical protein